MARSFRWLLLLATVPGSTRAGIDNVEVVGKRGSVYDIKVTGSFQGGSGSFYLVTDEDDSERIPCRYDGGLTSDGGLVLPDHRKRVWSINRNMVHTINEPKHFKKSITCTAHLATGSYLMSQAQLKNRKPE